MSAGNHWRIEHENGARIAVDRSIALDGGSMNHVIDAARLKLILNDLRLPAIKENWPTIAEQSDKEGWPAARFLAALAEHEIAERDRRRIERHLAEARLLPRQDPRQFRLRCRADGL